ncbi:MAG: hypothetical protein Q4C47_08805, partial [Planctomycetia bacterium]|nr:hypothetical protein [Planctomycetia bacterium]
MNRLSTFWETRLRPILKTRSFFSPESFRFLESGSGYRLAEWDAPEKELPEAAHRLLRERSDGSPVRFWVDERTLSWFAPESLHVGGAPLLTLFCGGDFPPVGSGILREVLEQLCDRCDLSRAQLPEWTTTEEREFIRSRRSSGIVEAYLWIAHRLLMVPDSTPSRPAALRFLASLGIPAEESRRLGLGFHASHAVFRDGLSRCGYTEEEVAASELISSPWMIGRLVGPIRDFNGVLCSMWAYQIQEAFTTVRDTATPEFLFKGMWKEQIGFFGLPEAVCPERHPESAQDDVRERTGRGIGDGGGI